MRVMLISIFTILLTFAWTGCASIPLYQSEVEEHQKAMEGRSDLMDFFNEGLKDADRTAISVKLVRSPSSDVLKRELVKSRKSFSRWTRFKRWVFGPEITREEMDVCTEIF